MPSERRIVMYARLLTRVLGRPLAGKDGVRESRLRRAEKRLHLALPEAIRDFYLLAGAAPETREHNRLLDPEDLVVEAGHLLFMEENQGVVDWGFPLSQKGRADPRIWQRVNDDPPRWYSERMPFSAFILKYLAWLCGVELAEHTTLTRSAKPKRPLGSRS